MCICLPPFRSRGTRPLACSASCSRYGAKSSGRVDAGVHSFCFVCFLVCFMFDVVFACIVLFYAGVHSWYGGQYGVYVGTCGARTATPEALGDSALDLFFASLVSGHAVCVFVASSLVLRASAVSSVLHGPTAPASALVRKHSD